ncbi:MAG TPA: hypothetical protein VH988_31500 [Thermoanaerobaculia bacterium]|nr:hypothetical protein [Thermoanaerobaculia bacterium]
MRISREASAWLSAWLMETKAGLAKLQEIGERARETASGGVLRVEDLAAAAGQVELDATCPGCAAWPPPAALEMEAPLEDAVFGQIVFALARGAGNARLSLDACAWFHDRYAAWLTATKVDLVASPLEVWETMGNGFLSRFKAIGEGVRSVTGVSSVSDIEISLQELQASAWEVEAESPCSYCPSEPGVQDEDAFGWNAGLSSRSLLRVQLPA